jgi:DNA polymerase-3 subunit epsilon
MREIVLDTETTGLDPRGGHRVIEIGCLELENHLPTGTHLQLFVNPERDIPEEAVRVHGLTAEFLADKPRFGEVVDDVLEFLGDAPLVIHNAAFDIGFLNAELERVARPLLDAARAIDTVQLARRRFPGAQASLDALCRRFEIDLSARTQHGALLDCQLLAAVYLELRGGRQPGFELDRRAGGKGSAARRQSDRSVRPARPHAPSEDEAAAHKALLEKITDPLWLS